MEPNDQGLGPNRRDFIKLTAAGLGAACSTGLTGCTRGAALATAPERPLVTPPLDRVRVGFVGIGGMGAVHVRNLLAIDGVEMRALCDIVEDEVARAQRWVQDAGQPPAATYTRGERDFERMCDEQELDLVINATPWRWHVPICVAAMRTGKHTATEVPAATTIDGCWELVETAEKTRRHCLMLENCNYDRREMMILNMVRQGLLGELLHGECGYLHDLRAVKLATTGEGLWRWHHSTRRNGNLYPTHGLGPIAQCMDINRGDQLDYLVSMSSNARGLGQYARQHLAADDPRKDEDFILGDVNTTLIRTVRGRTITVVHDTNLPRPYSRINLLQGTRGLVHGYPDRIHVEGRSPHHAWEPLEDYADEFEHPLWKQVGERGKDLGHGSMDYLESARMIACLRHGEPLDMDVYDAAMLSVICELSERSVASGSRPIDIPDFTRGRWKTHPPLGIVDSA